MLLFKMAMPFQLVTRPMMRRTANRADYNIVILKQFGVTHRATQVFIFIQNADSFLLRIQKRMNGFKIFLSVIMKLRILHHTLKLPHGSPAYSRSLLLLERQCLQSYIPPQIPTVVYRVFADSLSR